VVDDRRGCCLCSTGATSSAWRNDGNLSWAVSRQAEAWCWGKVLTRLIGWSAATLEKLTAVAVAIWPVLELHSSDSQLEGHDVELVLDACDAASEKTEEVEEEAEEERAAA
jgi:hypothetical protein